MSYIFNNIMSYDLNHVDKYTLKDNEIINDNKIYCMTCGELLKEKRYSPMQKAWIWSSADENYNTRECQCMIDAEKKRNSEEHIENIKRFYNRDEIISLVGRKYADMDFEMLTINKETSYLKAKTALERYVSTIDVSKGKGWYIFSPTAGNGKTTLMACVRNNLVRKGIKCVMINVQNLLDFAKTKTSTSDVTKLFDYSMFRDAEVLLIDDIGAMDFSNNNSFTSWANQELYELINYRDINNMCTCFTSNYSIDDLRAKRGIDFKTADRIMSRATFYQKVDGASMRSNFDKYKE